MLKPFYFLLIIFVLMELRTVAAAEISLPVSQDWQEFIGDPSPEKARLLIAKIQTTNQSFYLEKKIIELEERVQVKGNPNDLKAAFILQEFSDGAIAESLDQLIAASIVPHPEVYIKEAYKYKDKNTAFLCTGTELVDDFHRQVNEIKKRKKALDSLVLQDKSLIDFRDKLIKNINKEIERLEQLIQ